MKRGCIIALVVVICLGVIFVTIAAVIGLSIYRGVESIPSYAKKEVVYANYNTFIGAIDIAAQQSTSREDLVDRLEEISKPENLIYMALDDDQQGISHVSTTIVKKREWSSHSTIVINGTGIGKLDGDEVIIIEHPVEKHGVADVIIYLLPENQSGAGE